MTEEERINMDETCWRCWPKICRCPPPADEVERILSERFIAEQAWRSELSRRRAAEVVIRIILDDHSAGDLSLSAVVEAAREYVKKYFS